ncbi:MAG: hypothetical protein WCI34_05760 [Actinomycetes bacterium]
MRSLKASKGEILLGAAFAFVSVAVMAALLSRGRILTGAESQVGADQLQYLSWVVSSGEHLSIRSLWSIPAQQSSGFFHPGFLISGLLNRAGVDVVLSYQLWKLLAIPLVVAAFAAHVRELLPKGGARTAALALALFGLSPAGAIWSWNRLVGGFRGQLEFAAGEVFAPSWMWGYMMTGIAVALMVIGLLLAQRATRPDSAAVTGVLLCVTAFLCSWLQPWQGAELIGAVLICDLVMADVGLGRMALLRRRLPFLLAALAPLIYYRWLSGTEDVWAIAAEANNRVPLWSLGVWVLTFLPWLPAIRAYGRRPSDWQQLALRVVPLLMVGEFAVVGLSHAGTFPFHAVQGISLFLGILAVEGMLLLKDAEWWRARLPLGVGLCLIMCVPGTVHRLNLMRLEIHRSAQPYFLDPGEDAALKAIASKSGSGGVLAPIKAALSVPGHTGRPVWVGELSWTPDFRARVAAAEKLFRGRMSLSTARRLIDSSGARFLYSDCGHRSDLTHVLGSRLLQKADYGCARVYELKGGKA